MEDKNELEVFVTLRSPYSYLASFRLRHLAETLPVPIMFRPVYPIATKTPDFFEKNDPLWLSYLVRDTARVAEMTGTPFHWPDPDPIAQDLITRKIADAQPLIRRITRLTMAAEDTGLGLLFYCEVSALIFGGTKGWDTGPHLAEAAARAGCDLSALEAQIAADPGEYDRKIDANYERQRAAGHWGTPLLVFNGEPFFGQDRIDMCLWRMNQAGVDVNAAMA